MTQSDAELLTNLFVDEPVDDAGLKFSKKNWRYIPDINNNSYGNKTIKIDTRDLTSDFIVWSEAMLRIRMSMTLTGANAGERRANGDRIMLKNHVSSLFQNVLIRINNKNVNNGQDHIRKMELIRYLTEHSSEHADTCGNLVGFEKDTVEQASVYSNAGADETARKVSQQSYSGTYARKQTEGNPVALALTAIPAVFADLPAARTAVNTLRGELLALDGILPTDAHPANRNEGAVKRLQYRRVTYSTTTNVDDTLTYEVYVPLSAISPVFRALDFPATNLRLQCQFQLAPFAQAFMYDVFQADGVTVTVPPADYQIVSAVNLYYNSVDFAPSSNAIVQQKLMSGSWKKMLKYHSHKRFIFEAGRAVFGNSHQFNITTGIDRVKKIWILVTPEGRIQGGTTTGLQADQAEYSDLPTGSITNAQLFIDNVAYYESVIVDDQEFYDLLDDQLSCSLADPRNSSLLDYDTWSSTNKIYCFDVSRSDKTDSVVSLRFNFDRADTNVNGVNIVPATVPCHVEAYVEYDVTTIVDLANPAYVDSNEQ